MTHTYKVSGMTCIGYQAKVQGLFSKVDGFKKITIDLIKGEATIDMDKHIVPAALKAALLEYPKYQLTESLQKSLPVPLEEENKFWITTYKPILVAVAVVAIFVFPPSPYQQEVYFL